MEESVQAQLITDCTYVRSELKLELAHEPPKAAGRSVYSTSQKKRTVITVRVLVITE